jgi:hypothetical protein
MSAPKFERTPNSPVFSPNNEIYVIDENKVDLWRAKIKKVFKKGYLVHFEDTDQADAKFPHASRLLAKTDTNNGIYQEQARIRASIPESEPEIKREPEPKGPEGQPSIKSKKEGEASPHSEARTFGHAFRHCGCLEERDPQRRKIEDRT